MTSASLLVNPTQTPNSQAGVLAEGLVSAQITQRENQRRVMCGCLKSPHTKELQLFLGHRHVVGHTGEGHWEVGGRGKSKGTTDSSKGTFLMPSVKECFTPSLLLAVRLRHNSIRAYIPSSGNAQC